MAQPFSADTQTDADSGSLSPALPPKAKTLAELASALDGPFDFSRLTEPQRAFLAAPPAGAVDLAAWTAAADIEGDSALLVEAIARQNGPPIKPEEAIAFATLCAKADKPRELEILLSFESARDALWRSEELGLNHSILWACEHDKEKMECLAIFCACGVNYPMPRPGQQTALMHAFGCSLDAFKMVLSVDADPGRIIEIANLHDTQRFPFTILKHAGSAFSFCDDKETLARLKLLGEVMPPSAWGEGLEGLARRGYWESAGWVLDEKIGLSTVQCANAVLFNMAWGGAPMSMIEKLLSQCNLRAKDAQRHGLEGRSVLDALSNAAKEELRLGGSVREPRWERIEEIAVADLRQPGLRGVLALAKEHSVALPRLIAAMEAAALRKEVGAVQRRALHAAGHVFARKQENEKTSGEQKAAPPGEAVIGRAKRRL